jgi:hypothetical protein
VLRAQDAYWHAVDPTQADGQVITLAQTRYPSPSLNAKPSSLTLWKRYGGSRESTTPVFGDAGVPCERLSFQRAQAPARPSRVDLGWAREG